MPELNQKFYMSHKLTPIPRLFQLVGRNPETKTFEYVIIEVETGEISEVEREWFNTHKIVLA
jgi:hypothetical protein